MKILSRCILAATLLVGCTVFANADTITWTFSDVVFTDGNVVSGNFVTDTTPALDIQSFDITVSGAADVWSFFADSSTTGALSNPALVKTPNGQIEMGGDAIPMDPFDPFVVMDVAGALSDTGGTYTLTDGFDCKNGASPNCQTLEVVGEGHTPELIGTLTSAVPEPSTLPLLGLGVIGMVAVIRRKFARVS
jgi:PEP-CTERM motif-containing protein